MCLELRSSAERQQTNSFRDTFEETVKYNIW